MEKIYIKYVHEFFDKLIEKYGFKIKEELNDGRSYMIEYSSENFVIHIEKYFREFYVSLEAIDDADNGIDLFNLLEYLKRNFAEVPKSEYFRKEKNIDECYGIQLNHITTTIYENYTLLNDFFSEGNYELKIAEFEEYWKNKHPELYK